MTTLLSLQQSCCTASVIGNLLNFIKLKIKVGEYSSQWQSRKKSWLCSKTILGSSSVFHFQEAFKVPSSHQLHYWNFFFHLAQAKAKNRSSLWLTLIIKMWRNVVRTMRKTSEKGNLFFMKREQEKTFKKSLHLSTRSGAGRDARDKAAKAVRVYVFYGVEIYLLRFSLRPFVRLTRNGGNKSNGKTSIHEPAKTYRALME